MKRSALLILFTIPLITLYGQEFDSIIDARDGQQYRIVLIGDQWWMAENIRATKYVDGTAIPNVIEDIQWDNLNSTDKAYCWMDNDSTSYAQTYGALYTWAAAMNGAASSNTNPSGVQGVCPIGWHLPSNEEWIQLEMSVGMSRAVAETRGFRGTNEGSKLAGIDSLWDEGALKNDPEFGISGFTVLPADGRFSEGGQFGAIGGGTSLWSSTETSTTNALRRGINKDNIQISHHYGDKALGRSVRCVRNGLSLDSIQIDKVNVGCYGYSDGSIAVSVLDEGQFSYKWSTGDTTFYLSNLPTGEYWVTISDSTGAAISESIIIMEPEPIQVEFTTTPSCYGDSTGSIAALVTGGTPPYTYLWSNNESTANISGFPSGNYIITIIDHNGCITVDTCVIDEYPEILTGQITGQTIVDPAGIYVYSVNQKPASDFTWIVNGGNIVSGLGTNSIDVQWGSAGTGMVSVVETDEYGCNGDTVRLEVLIGSTGLDYLSEHELRIYPNPTSAVVIIEFPNPDHAEYKLILTDLTGKVIRQMDNITEDNIELNINDLSEGIYMLELNGPRIYQGKLVIE